MTRTLPLPAAARVNAVLSSDRFVVERTTQDLNGNWLWAVMDTVLARPVDIYADWGAEYYARDAARAANMQALRTNRVRVPASFQPLGPTFNYWCLSCGAWWITRYSDGECDCEVQQYFRDKQGLRDRVLAAAAASAHGERLYIGVHDVAWRAGLSRAKTQTRLDTLVRRGLIKYQRGSTGPGCPAGYLVTDAGVLHLRTYLRSELRRIKTLQQACDPQLVAA